MNVNLTTYTMVITIVLIVDDHYHTDQVPLRWGMSLVSRLALVTGKHLVCVLTVAEVYKADLHVSGSLDNLKIRMQKK